MRFISTLIAAFGRLIALNYVFYLNVGVVGTNVPLTLLSKSSPGRCMDGTPAGYYFDKAATSGSSNKWIFDLEGGGECVTKASCESRMSSLGTSKHFKNATELHFLASGSSRENPYAHSWNRVFIPYCSQDLWSGTRTNVSDESFGLYFSGHIIVQEVFKSLLASTHLSMASEVVVTGESAGGIGSWLNVGWFKQQLPKAQTVVAPIAGFYAYAFPYSGPSAGPAGLADFGPDAWQGHYQLWQAHVDDNCKSAYPQSPWFCMIANNSRPSIDAPAFVIEAQTDKVQLEAHDNIPSPPWSKLSSVAQADINSYVLRWKQNMTSNVHRLHPSDGYFFPACYIHTTFSRHGPFITKVSSGRKYMYSEAFGEWHAALGSPAGREGLRLEDSCGVFCGKCSSKWSPAPTAGIIV